jgi:hypothetical protein
MIVKKYVLCHGQLKGLDATAIFTCGVFFCANLHEILVSNNFKMSIVLFTDKHTGDSEQWITCLFLYHCFNFISRKGWYYILKWRLKV